MKEIVVAMMNGSVIGSELAKLFGLHTSYFAHNIEAQSLNPNIKIIKYKHVVLVEIPPEAREYIKNYIATPLAATDDESDFDYILPLTSKIKIGFWK